MFIYTFYYSPHNGDPEVTMRADLITNSVVRAGSAPPQPSVYNLYNDVFPSDMTPPQTTPSCPLCCSTYSALSSHLRKSHGMTNLQERKRLLNLATKHVNIRDAVCPVSGCTYRSTRPDKSLPDSRLELSPGEVESHMDVARRERTVTLLAALRATNPSTSVMTTLDLEEEEEEEEPMCTNPECGKQLDSWREKKKSLRQKKRKLEEEVFILRRKYKRLVRKQRCLSADAGSSGLNAAAPTEEEEADHSREEEEEESEEEEEKEESEEEEKDEEKGEKEEEERKEEKEERKEEEQQEERKEEAAGSSGQALTKKETGRGEAPGRRDLMLSSSTAFPSNNEKKMIIKEEPQDWSLDQEDQEDQNQPHRVKEEQEEVRTSQEGEQLQGFTFTPVPVKSEDDDDEEKPQSSQLHQRQTEQIKTEADEDDCGGPAPTRNSDPDTHLQPDTDEMTEDLFEPETGVCNDDKTTREAPLVLNCMKNHGFGSCEKSFPCVVCGKQFNKNSKLQIHMRTHTGEKPFSCSLCFKKFSQKSGLDYHLKTHTAEKPFSCSVCGKTFGQKAYLHKHMKCHTGVKPYSCPFCNKCFLRCEHLQSHMRTHTGEKPFRCSLCDKRFSWRCQLKTHKCVGKSSQLRGLWTRQEGEQLQGLQEADITKFTFTPVPVKSEDDEEKPQSSQLHQRLTEQIKTEADYGGPEPARNSE
ncbi:zinc finger protein 37 homolog isoform X2 [Morone saxatilis]|uniref:zinc finger protein 37 homolog isoform X2 n=1 Tax=Morone saxatilis TaxID=34816 RepID=UPI0015E1F6F3|nr:zinc finger protein 37 homolog isoform X2 [Morone saxatilis]